MKKIVFIVMISLMAACDSELIIPPVVWYVQPAIKKHVDQFILEASKRGHEIKRHNLFIVLTDGYGGVDKYTQGKYKKRLFQHYIYIYGPEYVGNTDRANEVLIFHELGHWQGLKHNEATINIMNAHADDVYLYGVPLDSAKRERALDEFFKLL